MTEPPGGRARPSDCSQISCFASPRNPGGQRRRSEGVYTTKNSAPVREATEGWRAACGCPWSASPRASTTRSAGRAARTPKRTAASPLEPSVARLNLLGAPGVPDRVRSRMRLHGGRCRPERELKRCHISPRRKPIRGSGEAPSGRRQRVMAIGRVHQRLTAKGPRDITPPRPRPPGAPGATHLETNVAGLSAREPTRARHEPGRSGY